MFIQGMEKTLKWAARYGLLSNAFRCADCQQADAALIKQMDSVDKFEVYMYMRYT